MIDKVGVRRASLRAGVLLSLVAAGLAGGVLATEIHPADKVAAALHHLNPAPPSPTATPHPTAVPLPAPVAPTRAMLAVGNGPALPYGSWIQAHSVDLRVTLPPASHASTERVEVEVLPSYLPFTGAATATSSTVALSTARATVTTITVPNLHDGESYHWRVRASSSVGASPWALGGVFGVNNEPPAAPQVVTTNVALGSWGQQNHVLFRWTDTGSRVPISYYQYTALRGKRLDLAAAHWLRVSGSVLSLAGLKQGYWHVFVRAVDVSGNVSQPASWGFGVAQQGPAAPVIASAAPAPDGVTNAITPTLVVRPLHSIAPITGYEYTVARAGKSLAHKVWILTTDPTINLPGLGDGRWQVAVRSVDAAGNRSAALLWKFHIDRQVPQLHAVATSASSFTPPVEKLHITFALSKTAVVTYTVTASGSTQPVASGTLGQEAAGKTHTFSWSGLLAHHKPVSVGSYVIHLEASDAAGNSSTVATSTVSVLDKRILVSISKEELWAYQGNTLILHTPVTNGGPDTPTIPGIFHVLGKYPGWVFHSPWPPGSPLWYPDSPTNFALLYQAQGGYFVHDSPWRSNYGPGSNSLAGTPGGNYTGTHGCTNVPYAPMQQLFNWADVGTVIQIVK